MTTLAQKNAIKRYHESPKGKEALRRAQKKYELTRKAKARARKYAQSAKGQEARDIAKQKAARQKN